MKLVVQSEFGLRVLCVALTAVCFSSVLAADEIPSVVSTQLLSLDNFRRVPNTAATPTDFTIDPRVGLLSLSDIRQIQSLTIDTRLGQLRLLADFTKFDISNDITQLATLAEIANRSKALAEATVDVRKDETLSPLPEVASLVDSTVGTPIQDIQLPEIAAVPRSPTLFLRDFRTTIVNELSYDSNAFASTDNIGVWYLKTDITASAALQRRNNSYLASYSFVDNRDLDGTTDSIRNRRAYVNIKQELGLRKILTLTWQHDQVHETLGSGLLEGIDTQDFTALAVTRNKYSAAYRIGDDSSKMRVQGELYYFDQSYEQSDAVVDVGSYHRKGGKVDVNYNAGSKTSILGSINYEDFDYDLDDLDQFVGFESLDATSVRYDAGVSRDIGRRSNLKAQLGVYTRDFVAAREDERIRLWSLEYTMNRRSYSRLSASIGQQFSPSRGLGTFIRTDQLRVSLIHSWNDRFRSRGIFGYFVDEFVDTDRVDHRYSLSSIVEYSFSERWRLSGGLRYSQRRSSASSLDFDRTLLFMRSTYQF